MPNNTLQVSSRTQLTQYIKRLHRKHPDTRVQRSYHGAERYSVQFFSKDGKLVADYDILTTPKAVQS